MKTALNSRLLPLSLIPYSTLESEVTHWSWYLLHCDNHPTRWGNSFGVCLYSGDSIQGTPYSIFTVTSLNCRDIVGNRLSGRRIFHTHSLLSNIYIIKSIGSPVISGFPSRGPVMRSFHACFGVSFNDYWLNSRIAGDLRPYGAHIGSL